jgi:steroid delta-isomerase-like uncharacterized protein
MSTEANKALVRRFLVEVENQKNLHVVDEVLAGDYVLDMPGFPTVHGPAGYKKAAPLIFSAFPDLHHTVEDIISEGDRVAARVTTRATHRGQFLGIPWTGKQVMWTTIHLYRITGGKIVEDRVQMDMMGLMQQLGITTPVPQ